MRLTILGASGHGKVVADIAKLSGYDDIEFLDDNDRVKYCGQYPVVGRIEQAQKLQNDLFVGIGNSDCRKRLMSRLAGSRLVTLIHPSAVVAKDVKIDIGTVIMAGAVINPGVKLGKGVIINTCSSVDHDCTISDFVHVAVGAHLCGNVKVGDGTWIGAGAIVSNNVDICNNCVIGAGAVVIKNIDYSGTYVGVPAKRI